MGTEAEKEKQTNNHIGGGARDNRRMFSEGGKTGQDLQRETTDAKSISFASPPADGLISTAVRSSLILVFVVVVDPHTGFINHQVQPVGIKKKKKAF